MARFRRKTFLRRIRARFLVRFHMALILVGTFLSGLLASKVLLEAGVDAMAVRYPLAVLLSYLAFFLFVKIWLRHVSPVSPEAPDRAADAVDGVLDVVDLAGGPSSAVEKAIRFGGGQAGGGGAGGAFDVVADVGGGTADAAGKAAAGAGEAAGEIASGILDADECALPLILLGALLAAVFGAGLYLIWQAPSILPEAAFDAALAASLLRGAKRIDAPDWTGGVLRATWKPFLWIAAVTLAVALAAAHYFPHARRLADLFLAAR